MNDYNSFTEEYDDILAELLGLNEDLTLEDFLDSYDPD